MSEAFTYETWETGSDETKTTLVKIAATQTIPARTPLGQNATTGLFHVYDADATDGTELPVYLTAFAVDTTGGAASFQVIKSGTFNPDLVNWNDSEIDLVKATAFVGTPISLQAPR